MEASQVFDIVDYEGWSATPDRELLFSSDHVIDAYVKGKDEGVKSEKSLIGDTIIANMKTSSAIAKEAVEGIKKLGFNPTSVFLKIVELKKYILIITIPENQFLSDSILDVYDFLTKIEDASATDYYSVNISLCDITADFDEKCLSVDGYLKYRDRI